MLECIVTKFGGSSLANDEQFRKVRSILELEPTRRYLVPSAPGKRFKDDDKVTDLLYACHALAAQKVVMATLFLFWLLTPVIGAMLNMREFPKMFGFSLNLWHKSSNSITKCWR